MDAQSWLGLVLTAVGCALTAREIEFLRRASIATGEVVDLDTFKRDYGEGEFQTTWPVIEFADSTGAPRRIVDVVYTWRRKGETVRVAFPAGSPEKARVYTAVRFWALPAVTIAAGIVMVFGPHP